jgi:hypothetical protein
MIAAEKSGAPQSRVVEEAGSLAPGDEKIDVAVRAGFVARDGPDQPNLRCAVAGGDANDRLKYTATPPVA